MSTIKLPAASGGGSISLKGPSTLGSDRDLVDTSGHINLLDSQKVKFGDSNDLQIYHDGSSGGFLEVPTGYFTIRTGTNGTKYAVVCIANAETQLYHNDVKQCETSANGLAFPSGKGIDFSAHSNLGGMTSELLDDYEEGTWSPSPRFAGSGAGTSGSFTGAYVKIGQQVTIWLNCVFTDKGSFNSGDALSWANIPFAAISNDQAGFMPGFIHRMQSSKQVAALVNASSFIDMKMCSTGSGTNSDNMLYSDVRDDTHFIFAMSYRTDT